MNVGPLSFGGGSAITSRDHRELAFVTIDAGAKRPRRSRRTVSASAALLNGSGRAIPFGMSGLLRNVAVQPCVDF